MLLATDWWGRLTWPQAGLLIAVIVAVAYVWANHGSWRRG